MSYIDISHPHDKTPEQARRAIDTLVAKLGERFDIQSAWNGDVLNFSRSGLDGRIELLPQQVHITAKLGFLLSALKGTVESEIRRVLAEKFG